MTRRTVAVVGAAGSEVVREPRTRCRGRWHHADLLHRSRRPPETSPPVVL